jgi:tripartite-type tricarboxylate transporter receptor subunit TctC
MTTKLLFRALAAMAIVAATFTARAQDFPTKPINIVVPYPPGGFTDVATRALAPQLGKSLGQPIVVINRPGAGGAIGIDTVLGSPPDGYNIVLGVPATLSLFPITQDKYAGLNDKYTPLTLGVRSHLALLINPERIPVRSLKDFIAHLKANPGKLNYGTPGAGTSYHLWTEVMLERLGATATHVPYKGEAQVALDLAGGQIDFMLASGAVKAQVDSGKLLVLASGSDQRWSVYPNAPTFREQGVDLSIGGWLAYIGPGGLPAPIQAKIVAAFAEAYKDPEVVKLLEAQGNIPVGAGPQELVATIKAEQEAFGKLLKSGRVKLEQ